MRAVLAAVLALAAALAWAEPLVDAMRGATPILEATQPPRLSNSVNDDNRMPLDLGRYYMKYALKRGNVADRRSTEFHYSWTSDFAQIW